ncbi:proline-rich basic protein 1 [Ctenodactylus gundi]
MLTTLVTPALPGLSRRLPAAPARRQDSSGSSGSYHTAPGSPEPLDVGPDAESCANWPWVAPGWGAGAQPRLSVSAQNSRQQPWPGSGFQRRPGSGAPPPLPQLRMLPSGEMEVIFGAGPLFSRLDAGDRQEQRPTAPAFSPAPPAPAPPTLVPPQPRTPDGGSRWATYLEVRPREASPASSAQFECVEVALEERSAPVRPRTVPKRQIELRPRPPSPPRGPGETRPRLLLRTGSLDESLGRLQAAAGLVQTALAKKLGPATPAQSSATLRPTERPEPKAEDAARSPRGAREEARSRPPPARDSAAPARAPRPWPSLRERAIRRDKPAPGTEPLGPVSSSIFLQSEEKIQEAHNQEPKTRFQRENPDRIVPRSRSPPLGCRAPWEVPSRAERPRSPPEQAPNGAMQSPRCPSPQDLPPWDRAVWRVRSLPFPEASSVWENRDPALEDTVGRRSASPLALSQWDQSGARASSPWLEAPSLWEIPHPTVGEAAGQGRSPSPSALVPDRDTPDRPAGTRSLSPQETWGPQEQGSSVAFRREVMNGVAREPAPLTPSAPGTPEPTEAQSAPTRELPELPFARIQPSPEVKAPAPPRSHLTGTLDADARPEVLGSGEAASGRPRAALPRPRDVRKMVKTTYAPSFLAGSTGAGPPEPPAGRGGEAEGAAEARGLPAQRPASPALYTSVFLKDFLPVVPHPYEAPEPPPDAAARGASQPGGLSRRRAENSTAKPFARTELRLPGTSGPRSERTVGVHARGPGADTRDAEAPRLLPDGGGRVSPLGGARSSPQRSPAGPAGTQPPRPGCRQARPGSSPERGPRLETPSMAPELRAASQAPVPPPPRAASAPPADRSRPGAPLGPRRPLSSGPPPAGKVLVDPESGRCYLVEAPPQPRARLLFDPESGQYVEVLLPQSSPGPPRHVCAPLALGPGLYPHACGPVRGLSLPPSPGPSAFSSAQPPWAPEAGSLDGMYYLPVGGTPSPAPPLLLCAPSIPDPARPGKATVFPL